MKPVHAVRKSSGVRLCAYVVFLLLSSLAVSDFVMRSVVPAFKPDKTDFSELYTSAWLWRHGQNPYDSTLTTATQRQVVGSSVQIAPIYPLTTFVLVAPFTFLSWGWANFLWLMLGLGGVAASIVFLLWLRGPSGWGLKTAALITFLLCFDPLHQAFHLGNVALIVVPLAFAAIVLAEEQRDTFAGLLLALAVCLKPQIGVWVLAYYLLRGRLRIFITVLAGSAPVLAAVLLHPLPFAAVVASYRANLQHWFAPGRPYGFTEGALPFHVNSVQVILYQACRSVLASNLMAYALFLTGLALWLYLLWRGEFRAPASLAISSLLALSFLSLYHSVSDATILTLALCWAFPGEREGWSRIKILTCVLFLLMMLPGHSALMRLSPHLNSALIESWWWKLFVARYFVWLLLVLNGILLAGLVPELDLKIAAKETVRQQSELASRSRATFTS